MNKLFKNKDEFDGLINISSNIKDNKRTIIAKFDLKDLLFILIAIVVGIIVITIFLILFGLRSILPLIFTLGIIELPILTLGFARIYNMPFSDYLKMKRISNNSVNRLKIIRKKSEEKFLIHLEVKKENIEKVLNDIKKLVNLKSYEISILKNISILVLNIDVNGNTNLYKDFLIYLIKSNDIKYISLSDIKKYNFFIKTCFLVDEKYSKDNIKKLEKLKKVKLEEYKKDEKLNKNIFTNNKTSNLGSEILTNNDKFIKVYKILLYKHPIDDGFLQEVDLYNKVIYGKCDDSDFSLKTINYTNTFIYIIGDNEDKVIDNSIILENMFKKYNIIFNEINEENVKSSLYLMMENRF